MVNAAPGEIPLRSNDLEDVATSDMDTTEMEIALLSSKSEFVEMYQIQFIHPFSRV